MTYFLSAMRTLIVATALLFWATPAWAEEEAILLLVHGDPLPKERLRAAIEKELGKHVAAEAGSGGGGGVVTVTYRAGARELAVTWDGPKRGTVSRVVTAPEKVDDVVRDAALLAGNLARDEADELLGPKPAPAPAPAPLPPLPDPASSGARPGASASVDRATSPPRDPNDRDFNLGVIYPLATNFGRPQVTTRFDWNLLSSRIGELQGFQLGGVNVVSRDASGFEIGIITNVVGGTASGWQLSPFVNRAGALDGIQTAMLVNSAGRVNGGQLAALNVAGDLDGAQIGLVNVGGHVRGATVGLINVADRIDGVPFGIASITKDGGVHPRAWSSTSTFANLGIKLATRHTYTMPSAHYHRDYDRDFYGAGFTIGGHIPFVAVESGPYLDTELAFSWLYAPKRSLPESGLGPYHQHLVQPRLRALLGWRFVEHFSVFAGAGLLTQVRLLDEGERASVRVGPEFVAGLEL